jgi:hypothetical protein
MKKDLLKLTFLVSLASGVFYSCTKDVGINPLLAYSDKALYDSCKNDAAFMYYQNAPTIVYSGVHGPHGPFKLKFNKIAYAALTDNGKLPVGTKFPDGSLVVKEVQSSGMYALLYKKSGSWLWGEINANGTVVFSVNKDASGACVSCHSLSGERDLMQSFNFY